MSCCDHFLIISKNPQGDYLGPPVQIGSRKLINVESLISRSNEGSCASINSPSLSLFLSLQIEFISEIAIGTLRALYKQSHLCGS